MHLHSIYFDTHSNAFQFEMLVVAYVIGSSSQYGPPDVSSAFQINTTLFSVQASFCLKNGTISLESFIQSGIPRIKYARRIPCHRILHTLRVLSRS